MMMRKPPAPPAPTLYFVDGRGNYIGGFAGAEPPAGAIQVPTPPPVHASQIWDGQAWGPYVPPAGN